MQVCGGVFRVLLMTLCICVIVCLWFAWGVGVHVCGTVFRVVPMTL